VVKVDEEGTEAAAVTAVVFGPTAIMGGARVWGGVLLNNCNPGHL
jgi:serine protease inhibitor